MYKFQEVFENNKREITRAMMKNYPRLLRKFMADKAKVPSLIDIVMHMKLELYSLKRDEKVGWRIVCKFKLLDTICILDYSECLLFFFFSEF